MVRYTSRSQFIVLDSNARRRLLLKLRVESLVKREWRHGYVAAAPDPSILMIDLISSYLNSIIDNYSIRLQRCFVQIASVLLEFLTKEASHSLLVPNVKPSYVRLAKFYGTRT